jgi:hypothetical protein
MPVILLDGVELGRGPAADDLLAAIRAEAKV